MSLLSNTRGFAFIFLISFLAAPARAALPTDGMKRDSVRFGVKPSAKSKIWATPSDGDYKALAQFRAKTSAAWKVSYSNRTGAPEVLKGGSNLKYSGAPEKAARQFLADNSSFLKVNPDNIRVSTQVTALGVNHLRFDQYVNGLPVHGGYVKVHVTNNGEIAYYQSSYATDAAAVPPNPTLSKDAAQAAAAADCSGRASKTAELVYYPSKEDGAVHLAWKLKAYGSGGDSWIYLIDANSGAILLRYSNRITATYGTINAQVYNLYPNLYNYTDYTVKPVRNQYVWVQTPNRVTTTDGNGYYSYSSYDGRIFASLKGPYFSVINMTDRSAHYDNGGGTWSQVAVSSGSAHPYLPGRIYSSTVTVAAGAVKVMPHFTEGFKVGAMDENSSFLVDDQLSVSIPNGHNLAGYTTWRDYAFYGAPVEGTSYTVTLAASADGPGDYYGYQIDYSSYLYLTQTGYVNTTSSFIWNTDYIPAGNRVEANLFYHLNEMHQFYMSGVNGATNPSLNMNFHLPVMAHAHGAPDDSSVGMLNAFYDSEHDNMMFGDGLWDSSVNGYRSFGLDATIIRHEYTHGVQAHMYPMLYYGESGALMEAYADYWSLTSLRAEDTDFTPLTTNFGDFLKNSFGEGVVRHLLATDCATTAAVCRKLGDWDGEVHDDSVILSQALWSLRDSSAGSSTYLGTNTFPASWAANVRMPVSDFLVWNAMFFFPDTFMQLKDGMEYVARQYYTGSTLTSILTKIETAFANHDIADPSGGDSYEPNNGAAVAASVSGSTVTLSATIYPAYDEDYYSVPMPAGKIRIKIRRPSAGDGIFNVQIPMILDLYGNVVSQFTSPDIANPTLYGTCPDTGLCYSTKETEILEADIPAAGRYYVVVTAGPNSYYYNCADSSTGTYTLTFDFSSADSAIAEKISAEFDNDEIKFTVPYNTYYYNDNSGTTPVWTPSTMTATVETFAYAQLRDSNMNILAGTKAEPDTPGTYLEISRVPVKDTEKNAYVGKVKLLPGFATRFPAVGAVYLELFGTVRSAMLGATNSAVSLGITQGLNLAADADGITVWNNIFNPAKEKAYILYKSTRDGELKLRIYTLDGLLVKELFSGAIAAGKGNIEWDGRNSEGHTVASGLYFLYASGPGFNATNKIVVIH
ncbi:MAG: FlgD immunoglobulin-like domain containing protein [Elusimicrobiaceae bacterium]|nr:FlgD immunoglobulin-like domain containing protein [Elusimicrobiaceae bacterium]